MQAIAAALRIYAKPPDADSSASEEEARSSLYKSVKVWGYRNVWYASLFALNLSLSLGLSPFALN